VEVPAWGDRDDFVCDDADVQVEAEGCVVHYYDDDGPVVLVGRTIPGGGFEFACRSRPRTGRIVLAGAVPAIEAGARLEGEFEELGESGRFSIVLGSALE